MRTWLVKLVPLRLTESEPSTRGWNLVSDPGCPVLTPVYLGCTGFRLDKHLPSHSRPYPQPTRLRRKVCGRQRKGRRSGPKQNRPVSSLPNDEDTPTSSELRSEVGPTTCLGLGSPAEKAEGDESRVPKSGTFTDLFYR